MGCRIIHNGDEGCLYDSVTDTAFGPVMYAEEYTIEEFLKWLPQDARQYEHTDLVIRWHIFQDAVNEHKCPSCQVGLDKEGACPSCQWFMPI